MHIILWVALRSSKFHKIWLGLGRLTSLSGVLKWNLCLTKAAFEVPKSMLFQPNTFRFIHFLLADNNK